jgi:Tfp pilus assembly protein PilO
MPENNSISSNNLRTWQFNRQINVSTLVQLVLLASLILGSWVNLQRQLDILQHDVTALLQCQKEFQQKVGLLSEKCISYEYRLRSIEKQISKADITP